MARTHQTWRAVGRAVCIISMILQADSAGAQESPARSVVDAYNASAQDLFKTFSEAPGNIVFSPYSIGTAMAMALSGSRGATEQEMLAVLKHRLKRPEIDTANGNIIAVLNGYDRSAGALTCPRGLTLNGPRCECPPAASNARERCSAGAATPPASAKLLTANALMLTSKGGLVSKDYTALLRDTYAAEVFQNAGLDAINGWVSRKTEGKIDKILDALDPLSAAVLLNAVYFKSRWASPFTERATSQQAFNLSRSSQIRVPTMAQTERFALTRQPGYRAIRLPYAIRDIGMIVVLPDEIDGLADVTRRLNATELPALLAALRNNTSLVRLELPRFKTEYRANLIPPFRQAGLKLALDERRADFSGITGRPGRPTELYLSQILHSAVIDVTEESTEAAAVTAIEAVRPASASQEPKVETFSVDRPFQFYIVDDATGAILFQGRIADPRQAMSAR